MNKTTFRILALTVSFLASGKASAQPYQYCNNNPTNFVDPFGDRAVGVDFIGPLGATDWRVNYTEADVQSVYATLAARDRHIYNSGLWNSAGVRETNRYHLERLLGVPVFGVRNPTFAQPGISVQGFGGSVQDLAGSGYTLNPFSRAFYGNLFTANTPVNPFKLVPTVGGGAIRVGGKALELGGALVDYGNAGIGKGLPIDYDPTYYRTRTAYMRALAEVQADPLGRVYGWMHSEGAIHGSAVINRLRVPNPDILQGYTFGAGSLNFRNRDVLVEHFGLQYGWVKDPIIMGAALKILPGMPHVNWAASPTPDVHAFGNYADVHMRILAEQYFKRNAFSILGR